MRGIEFLRLVRGLDRVSHFYSKRKKKERKKGTKGKKERKMKKRR